MPKMTPNQERFVEEYLKDLNATQAAIRAGYSEKGATVRGSELLANRKVADAIQEAKDKRSGRVKVDADWVLERLVRNAERGAQAEPVTDRLGNPTGEYQYEGGVVNKALELIGKHVGMFTDKLEVSGPKGGPMVREIVIEHHTPKSDTTPEHDAISTDREREPTPGISSGPVPSVE